MSRNSFRKPLSPFRLLTAPLLAALLLSGPVGAQVKPGDLIGSQNASKVQNLVAPGVYYKVERGMQMKITPTERIDWPPPYKDATEKYSGQVQLSKDRRSVVGYIAGQPFPLIDPNDPEVATKVIWNNVFRPIISDDYDLRFYDCYSLYQSNGPQDKVTEYFQIGHYAGYQLVGRTEVEPMPIDPDFKKTGRLWEFALYPVLAPATFRGVGFNRFRYADPTRPDDSWVYNNQARRIRRLNESAMSISSGPFAWEPDHYSGFNAKPEEYNYRFLGEKQMLGSVNAIHSPEVPCPTDGGSSVCPEAWEMRHLYIIEALPRRDAGASGATHSKSLLYIDSEAWFEPYIDKYDRQGQLWQSQIYWLAYRDRPVPDAKVAIYPFKRLFVVAAVSTDVQIGQATPCYLPGRETPERECWYINMGAVDKSFFTNQAMVRAAESGQ
jgi:hypothetical protein